MVVATSTPAKPKFTRASGPKVRTGCATWYAAAISALHEPCLGTPWTNQASIATCRRCHNENWKCDGYPKPPERKKRQPRAKPNADMSKSVVRESKQTLLPTINEIVFSTNFESFYFHHFLHSTTDQLSSWHGSSNFLAFLRSSAGAYMPTYQIQHDCSRSVSPAQSAELQRLAIYQNNKAIKSILPLMSANSIYDLHCILICCVLFISFKGLTGRYDDLLRHLRAGNQLLDPSLLESTPEQTVVTKKLVEMLSPLGSIVISFMDKDFHSGVSPWYEAGSFKDETVSQPFDDLDEASYELQRLSVQETDATWTILDLNQAPRLAIEEGFRKWSSRFETTKQTQHDNASSRYDTQLRHLRMEQQFRKLNIDLESLDSSGEVISDPALFAPLLDAAKSVAEPFLAVNYPNFSLNGELIRCLSYIAGRANQPSTSSVQSEALSVLRRLNRRESFWDSNDVVRMHEMLLFEEEDESGVCLEWEGAVPAGVPGFLEELRKARGFQGLEADQFQSYEHH
ncbi:hypothetical protein CEP52_009967 [Fusarium oligoseptatum]|uniref:Zn(2)-C6 fungal-type domain-containing protein n=1 Tax=Fusarium oligoseptatum TaxID=2604345 RepID=A0A428TAF4_9HYPO|nr:hypothetical protein CEP52_009967 [Fusarium oligoseptatum]